MKSLGGSREVEFFSYSDETAEVPEFHKIVTLGRSGVGICAIFLSLCSSNTAT
jgi:hypothetical protein